MAQLNKKSLTQLQQFISYIKTNPDALHTPQLKFFKDYLENLHAVIPPKKQSSPVEEVGDDEPVEEPPKKPEPKPHYEHKPEPKPEPKHEHKPEPKPEPKHEYKPEPKPEPKQEEKKEDEMEVEEEPDPLVIKPSDQEDENIEMGDPNKEVSEDDDSDSYGTMQQGRKAAQEGNHELAIQKLTEAIKLQPKVSQFFCHTC